MLDVYNQIVTRDLDTMGNLVSVSGRPTILAFQPPNAEAARLPHCIIRYNLSGSINRRLIGDDRTRLVSFLI